MRLKVLMFVVVIASSSAYAQNPKWIKCRGRDIPGEQIYRHYTGTVGDERVSLDLIFGFCGGSNYGGSTYYFPGEAGRTRIIIGEPDSFDLHIMLYANEEIENGPFSKNPFSEDERTGGSWDDGPAWTFQVLDDGIKGEWTSVDKKVKEPIRLKENYNRSVPMDLVWSENKTGSRLLYTRPSPKAKTQDAVFVTDEELTFLGEPRKHSQTLASFLSSDAGSLAREGGWLLPVYNDNGFLVFHREMERRGSSELRFHHKYLNLDVERQQVLALTDVLQPGKMLQALIETGLREKYDLGNDKKLSTWFRFENMPIGEFMLTDGGVTFCYDLDVLKEQKSGFTYDPILVEIPYCAIRDILQPGFRRRIGL